LPYSSDVFIQVFEVAEGSWVGLELSNANGDCDGTKEGKQYFVCDAKHGVFVQAKNIVKKIHSEEILKKFVNAQANHKAEMLKLKERMMKLKEENKRLREAYPLLLEDRIFEVVSEKSIMEMGCDKESLLAAWTEYVGMDAEGAREMSERDIKQNVAMCCFKICDKSGDGFIDIEEASNMYKSINNDEMMESMKNLDKDAFLDVLSGKNKSAAVNNSKVSIQNGHHKKPKIEEKEDDSGTWSVLKDNFMMGAKMRDWDKESDSGDE